MLKFLVILRIAGLLFLTLAITFALAINRQAVITKACFITAIACFAIVTLVQFYRFYIQRYLTEDE